MPVRRGLLIHHIPLIHNVVRELDRRPGKNFIIGNAQVKDCPIIYCNTKFCELYGYDRSEIVQKTASCDFLYGPRTSPTAARIFKQALQERKERRIEVVLYKKDGTQLLCSVLVAPLKNEDGEVILYILNHEDLSMQPSSEETGYHHSHRLRSDCKSKDKHNSTNNAKGSKTSAGCLSNNIQHRTKDRNIMKTSTDGMNNRHIDTSIPLMTLTSPTSSSEDSSSIHERETESRSGRRRDISTTSRKISFSLSDVSTATTSIGRQIIDQNIPLHTRKLGIGIQPQFKAASESNLARNSYKMNNLDGYNSSSFTNSGFNRLNSFPGVMKAVSGNMHHHKTQKVAQMMSLGPDVLPEYKVECPKIHPFTILHYSPFKAIWDWIILFLVMYTAIVTPYMASFVLTRDIGQAGQSTQGGSAIYDYPLVIIDYIVDVMFIIDIFINFRTTFVDGNDEVVSDPCRIAVHYMRGWLIIDLLAAIPFELLFMIGNTDQTTTLIGLLKTARLLRLVRVARKLDRYSEYGAALLLLLMFGFALIAHWLACIWYAIGNIERPGLKMNGWLHYLSEQTNMPYNKTIPNSGPDLKTKYIAALYYTLSSLTSVGFGNISANTNGEKIFTIMIMLGGSLMYAVIFGNVTAIIQRLYSGMAQYHSTMRRVREFIRFYQVPTALRRRLEDYAQYDYSFTNGIDMNEVLRNFPEGLQAEVCLHLNRHLLSSNIAFKSASPGCLRTLSLKLKTTHCPPGNYIIHYGDEITNLYWIGRGTVEVIQNDTIMAILGKGDTFGENFGLVLRRPTGKSKSSVRALTYCDLHALSRSDLLYILKAYPNFRKSFYSDLQVTYDLRDPELEKLDRSCSMFNIPSSNTHGPIFVSPEHLHFDNEYHTTKVDVNQTSCNQQSASAPIYENETEEYQETTNDELNQPLITKTSYDEIEISYDDTPIPTLLRQTDEDVSLDGGGCCCSCSTELRKEVCSLKSQISAMETGLKHDVATILRLLNRDSRKNGSIQKPSIEN